MSRMEYKKTNFSQEELYEVPSSRQTSDSRICKMPSDAQVDQMLRTVLCNTVEETITDEQVDRVLNPVLDRIKKGEFTQPAKPILFPRPSLRLVGVAAAITVVAFAAMMQMGGGQELAGGEYVEIPNANIPLAGAPILDGTLSGRPEAGGEMQFTLVRKDGAGSFSEAGVISQLYTYLGEGNLPDGSYYIMATFSTDTQAPQRVGMLTITEGRAELIFDDD